MGLCEACFDLSQLGGKSGGEPLREALCRLGGRRHMLKNSLQPICAEDLPACLLYQLLYLLLVCIQGDLSLVPICYLLAKLGKGGLLLILC